MRSPVDFLVVGGGPAGSMAASLLATRRNRVVLVERSCEAHHKVCGEFLSHEALRYLRHIDINPWRLGALPICKVRLSANNSIAERTLPFEAASLTRKIMDSAFLLRAQECGAELVADRQVEHLSRSITGWSAKLNDGQAVDADQVMLATGKHDLRGYARERGMQNDLVAFKMHMRLSSEQMKKLDETVELVLFPGGYLGLQPISSTTINLCMLVDKRKLRSIGGGWSGVLRYITSSSSVLKERLRGAEEEFVHPRALSQIPYGYVRREGREGLWALGDQAAVIPSFSGDGIAIAFHSAHYAAALHAEGRDAAEYSRSMYDQHHRRVKSATVVSKAMVGVPWAMSVLRYFPSLLQWFAEITRIPDHLLLSEDSMLRSDA